MRNQEWGKQKGYMATEWSTIVESIGLYGR